jgi:hypothetical protein
MTIYYNGAIVATTGSLVSGQGSLAFDYQATGPSFCTIEMYAPLSGTEWQYEASCPVPCDIIVNQISIGGDTYQFDVTGGLPPYAFSMDGAPFTSSSIFNLANGDHYLEIISDGCTKTHSFSIGNSISCSGSTSSGGQGTNFTDVVILGSAAGVVNISYEMYDIPDQMDVYYNGNLVATTGGLVSYGGVLSFFYPGTGPSSCTVRMYAPNEGTAWDYSVACPINTSINEFTNKPIFNIYPNPAQETLYVNLNSGSQNSNYAIEILDMLGRKVHESKQTASTPIDISTIENGLYFLIVSNGKEQSIQKFMKE